MTLISPHNGEPIRTAPKRQHYLPAPGRVLLLRQKVSDTFEGTKLVKATSTTYIEEAYTPFATVAEVGAPIPGGMVPFFKKGDVVTIEPNLLREIELSSELTIWSAPFSSVTGYFVDVEDDPN